MTTQAHLLDQAILEWRKGNADAARRMFKSILERDRQNEDAWIWYVYSLETNSEKIAALETFLGLFPHNVVGEKALKSLRAEEGKKAPARSVLASLPRREEGSVKQTPVPPVSPAHPVPSTSRKAAAVKYPWVLTAMFVVSLFFLIGLVFFIPRYVALQSNYQSLQANDQLLWENFQKLTREYQSVNDRLLVTQSQYSILQSDHQALQASYDTLLVDYYSSVESYEYLKETAIVPPYIYIRGREVNLSFLLPDQQIYEWTVPFEWLEYDLSRGNAERYKIKYNSSYPYIVLKNEFTNEQYRIIDYRKFVDSSEFTSFSQFFYERSASEEIFIEDIWYIVAQLTDYSNELSDTPRYPFETLLAGGGDCEDHAILFASMILAAAPPDWNVSLVYMDAYHPTRPEDLNHMIVYIETGTRTYTIEATGKEEMEPYTQGVEGWYHLLER